VGYLTESMHAPVRPKPSAFKSFADGTGLQKALAKKLAGITAEGPMESQGYFKHVFDTKAK